MKIMFKLRKQGNKQGNKQAKRNLKAAPSPSFSLGWRKSYNWGLLIVPVLLSGFYLNQAKQILPIRSIQLQANFENLNRREIEATLRDYIGQGFFSLDIHELQQALKAKPWTESVSVRRVWPDTLHVVIRERKPVARWDEQHLLSSTATVYLADSNNFMQLPLVHAANHSPGWALRQFHRLQTRFKAVDERVVALSVDSRGALDVELINGLQIKLGRDEIVHKIDRLVRIYQQQILPRREQIERLDLRYSNGFAVAWKKEVLQGSDKASIWSNSNV
jgi:cell division protein FtsQ